MIIVDAVSQVLVEAFAAAKRGTAARVARDLDVAPQTVSKWSKGETTPDRDRWPDLERLLDLEPGALMTAHRRAIRQRHDDRVEDAPELAELLAAFRELDASMRRLAGRIEALEQRLDPPSNSPAPSSPARARSSR